MGRPKGSEQGRFDKKCPCGKDIYEAGGSKHQDQCPDCLLATMPKGNGDDNSTPRAKPKPRVSGGGPRVQCKGGYHWNRKARR